MNPQTYVYMNSVTARVKIFCMMFEQNVTIKKKQKYFVPICHFSAAVLLSRFDNLSRQNLLPFLRNNWDVIYAQQLIKLSDIEL